MPSTLVLSRADIARTMTPTDYRSAVEDAFRQFATGAICLPSAVHIPCQGGGFHIKSASFSVAPHYVAVKLNGNFPGNPAQGLPTIQGAVLLCDGRNGSPLAILDSGEITAQRTGAASALAASHLAPSNASRAALIGCGAQARVQLVRSWNASHCNRSSSTTSTALPQMRSPAP